MILHLIYNNHFSLDRSTDGPSCISHLSTSTLFFLPNMAGPDSVLFSSFDVINCYILSLRHLHSEHSHGDRSIAQWKVQKDIVQCMETQVGTHFTHSQTNVCKEKCQDAM